MPKPLTLSETKNYGQHRLKWKDCQACPLCERRKRVVLGKGKLPCDVLMVGEAPGQSEDVLGEPFVGPAGHLLANMVQDASNGLDLRFFYTNLVACIPKNEDNEKVGEPDEESIKSCSDRLGEIVELANPKLVVCVGDLSYKWLPKLFGTSQWTGKELIKIIHPAAILRAEISVKSLLVQRTVVTLADAFAELK